MSELEIRKLDLEIQALETASRRGFIIYLINLVQGVSIIVGILIAINEFILKDREAVNQKSKITIEYIQKVEDREIILSKEALQSFRDSCYAVPVGNPREEILFRIITAKFDKATMNLAHFYNVLNDGIKSGFFDKKISQAFLAADVKETIHLLDELQSRHYGINTKLSVPNYIKFKGMIEFYISCYNITGNNLKRVPRYK